MALAERDDKKPCEEVVEMATFVLVHGAFGSPAELAPVIPELEALGHRAIAVDLPCTDPAATLDDYARTVVDAMAGIEVPVVVVGHSAGGATISLVPGRTRVDRLVYVTAFVPESGRSLADLAGDQVRETILSVSHEDGNGCRSFDLEMLASLAPPEEREARLAFLEATQRPQGWAAVEEPWPGRSLPDVPRTHVLCTEDTISPPAKTARDGGAPGRGAHRDRLRPCGVRPPAARARGGAGGAGRSGTLDGVYVTTGERLTFPRVPTLTVDLGAILNAWDSQRRDAAQTGRCYASPTARVGQRS